MARLRATASAARSVLDGREHGGTLGRVGEPIHSDPTIKKRARKPIKDRDHAQWRIQRAFCQGCVETRCFSAPVGTRDSQPFKRMQPSVIGGPVEDRGRLAMQFRRGPERCARTQKKHTVSHE
jgi:hypothetical protein